MAPSISDHWRLRQIFIHGKTSSGRVSKVRPVNPMESESASVEIPVGANIHDLIKIGMVR